MELGHPGLTTDATLAGVAEIGKDASGSTGYQHGNRGRRPAPKPEVPDEVKAHRPGMGKNIQRYTYPEVTWPRKRAMA